MRSHAPGATYGVVVAIIGALLLAASLATAGADAGATCTERKAKATGKKASDILRAFGRNERKPNGLKLGQDVLKARSKFTKAFTQTLKDSDIRTNPLPVGIKQPSFCSFLAG